MPPQALPTNPVGAYWPNFNPVTRIVDYPNIVTNGDAGFNLIFLFSAYPTEGGGGSTGAVTYNPLFASNLNADIVTCRARGQVVLLSIGGAGRQVYVSTKARADALLASIKTINTQLGGNESIQQAAFDGIDWNNFELGNSEPEWMNYISLKLKAYYGSGFLITAPPAAFDLNAPPAQGGADRLLIATMQGGGTQGGYTGTALDWVCPQFYDGINDVANIRNALNFYDDAVSVPGSTENGTTTQSITIPNSKIGIGFGMRTPYLLSEHGQIVYNGYWTPANAISAYTTIKSERGTVRGAFNWSMHLDATNIFPTNLGPTINPSAGGGATLTTVKTIIGVATASVKRINGILVSAIKSWNNKQ